GTCPSSRGGAWIGVLRLGSGRKSAAAIALVRADDRRPCVRGSAAPCSSRDCSHGSEADRSPARMPDLGGVRQIDLGDRDDHGAALRYGERASAQRPGPLRCDGLHAAHHSGALCRRYLFRRSCRALTPPDRGLAQRRQRLQLESLSSTTRPFLLLIVDAPTRTHAHRSLRTMFEARKRVFIDLLKWDLPALANRFEIDHFDDEHAIYLIVTDGEANHLASARLLPTTRPALLDSL